MHLLKPIPECEKIEFKEKFIHRYSQLTDWNEFKKYSCSFLRKSIRVNTLKISIAELKKRLEKDWILEQIPWCPEGFWISHKKDRLDVGNTIEHVLGYYYVQEAASMIPPIVLNPKQNEIVLDMCAAPGSKTSQIAQYMNNEGVLVANDVKGLRLAPLGINIQRMGITNCIITLMKGEGFKELLFDKILLDAPCSGTGTIRKSLKTINIWNPDMVKRISTQQKRLITTAWKVLKSGERLVYSTCSLEPEENEAMIDFLLKNNNDVIVEE
ncbi:RsmB/NOP family class I SAM-dependent RNA methyltransferase, partial [Candidatus Woesearchaeota archaeon]|nr:RsmB/NOP family class I SAM-dependent RNA methyltransferase [Candidatus Woesearchaeota archaeon]